MAKLGKRKYEKESLDNAISAVKSGTAIKTAARRYGVPRSTIQFRLRNPQCKDTFGPQTVLHKQEENDLVRWICELSRKGFPRKKDDVLRSVQEFLKQNPRETPFIDNRPGNGWYKLFLRRHPNLSARVCESVTAASACVSEQDIRKWFQDTEDYFKEQQIFHILKDPSRVFNGDETNFQLCPDSGKVLAEKGCKNVYDVKQGSTKESITVMFTFAANGDVTPPMIVYPYQRIPREVAESIPNGWGVGRSEKGWMKAEVFYEYIANILHPHLVAKGTTFPIIIFVDGHVTHLTYQLSELCSELKIVLIALYPNSTRILQPADVSAFRPIKLGWKNAVHEWRQTHVTQPLNKVAFASILKTVVDKYIGRDTIVHGFKACGLMPWDPNAVNYSKCLGGTSKASPDKNKCISPGKNSRKETRKIDIECFEAIAGPEIVEKFENMATVCKDYGGNEEFFILYRIWETLNGNEFEKEAEKSKHDIGAMMELPEVEIDYLPYGTPMKDFENNNSQTEIINDFNLVAPGTSSETPTRKVQSSTLGEFLVWPETPKRKGKQDTTRLPFVITSEKYKSMCREKEAKKKQAEDDKNERKRQRIEKKPLKEQNDQLRNAMVKMKKTNLKNATRASNSRNKPISQRKLFIPTDIMPEIPSQEPQPDI